MWFLPLIALLAASTNAQTIYKLCVTEDIYYNCKALERTDSKVTCNKVTDSAECAIKLARGEADFGIFNAEELLLAYSFYPNEIAPIYQLKNIDRKNDEFEFQTVAVVAVPNDTIRIDFNTLRGKGFCHPGYSETQWLNDYVLKYFERKIAGKDCQPEITAAENEARNIKDFFGKACRPGEWVAHTGFNEKLKTLYPELCELCDNPAACTYEKSNKHGHFGALDCLMNGRGKVAYVALSYAKEHLQKNGSYQFLCPDGRTQPLTTENPCAWIRQPWGVIAARKKMAIELAQSLKDWLAPTYSRSETWVAALTKIVTDEGLPSTIPEGTSTAAYLSKGREVDLPFSQTCKHPSIKWCTIGDLETEKCKWVAKEAQALGIEPQITCHNSSSTFQCFRDISNEKSDIITIDSNYGNLARTVYGLRTVLYSGTANDKNSVVIAVVRNTNNNPVKNFANLEGRTACFPEYGGIAWLSFVSTMRKSGAIASKSCDYPKLVSAYLSGACTPGVQDTDHSNRTSTQRRPEVASSLCSACPHDSDELFCAATEKNPYYSDKGAMKCLSDKKGDIAFVEMRNVKDSGLNSNEFRVLCKNGSLANYPGFEVDEYCALSVTIDSEIVGRKDSLEVDALDTTLALLRIEDWLGYSVHYRRPISIYESFNGTSDLLFKDSTSSLVNTTSNLQAVQNYKDLFSHVETCSKAALPAVINFSNTLVVAGFTFLMGRLF